MTYDEMRPGCFELPARLADMDTNHTELTGFPTFPRFCGQTFLEAATATSGWPACRPTTTG